MAKTIRLEKASAAFSRMGRQMPQAVVAGMRAGLLLAMKTAKYEYILSGGGAPIRHRLKSRSGGLRDSIRMVEPHLRSGSIAGGLMAGGARVPHARIHEKGGFTHPRVTPKSRAFFWAKFYETGDPMWKAMALSRKRRFTVPMPKRSYLHPALVKSWPQVRKQIGVAVMSAARKGFG